MNPAKKLKTNRRLWKLIVFGIITLGIYNIVAFEEMSGSLNLIASRYDGRKTMSFSPLLPGQLGHVRNRIPRLVP